MAREVTPPRHSRRGRPGPAAPLRGRHPADLRGADRVGPPAPELLAFVKALARDLARADAEARRREEDAGRPQEGACGTMTDHGGAGK